MSFDYDRYWLALEALKRPALAPTEERHIVLREWTWPPLRPYNGYTGVERVRGWQFAWWLKEAGVLAWPKTCDICGASGADYHSEDYYNVFTDPALCRACHAQVHKRFNNPKGRAQFVEVSLSRYDRFQPGSEPWLSLLPCQEIDLAGYVRERFGLGVLDLLNSPLYELPLGGERLAPT